MMDRFCFAIVRVLVLYKKKTSKGNKDGALSHRAHRFVAELKSLTCK